jgi:hypothetical protein
MRVTFEHVERIDAAVERVWPYFRWDNLDAMRAGGFFVKVAYGERRPVPGAIRVVTLSNGARLVERLESEDEDARRFAYALDDAGGAPVADYRGSVTVSPIGDACTVRFACECTPVGVSAEAWRATWTAMQVANAAFIRARVTEARRPG